MNIAYNGTRYPSLALSPHLCPNDVDNQRKNEELRALNLK